MPDVSIAARYISGQTIRQIADELKLPTQTVLIEVYTSDEFVQWVLSKPVNDAKFIARYLEVFTNDRLRDCAELSIGMVRYNHVKHALITSGRLQAKRHGIYTEKQVKALERFLNSPETRDDKSKRVAKRIDTKCLNRMVTRATGVKLTEYRRASGLSIGRLIEELGVSKSIIHRCIRDGILTIPYDDAQVATLLRRGLAMRPATNAAAPRWRQLIASIRDVARYDYVSTTHLCHILPATSRGVEYHTKILTPRLQLTPGQHHRVAYDREATALLIGEWLGPKYRWAVRQVDADWTPLKCAWYTWKTS